MKFAAITFIAIIVVVGYGFETVTAQAVTPSPPPPDLLNQLLAGVRTLLTTALSTLFAAINKLLLLIFKKVLLLLTLLLPASFSFELAILVPGLLALKEPTLETVAQVVLTTLKIDGTLVLAIVPVPILNTPIDVNELLKQIKPFLSGSKITFGGLLTAVAKYLGTIYSLELPSP